MLGFLFRGARRPPALRNGVTARRSFVPRLDVLEDRTVPSTLTVTNLSDVGAPGDGSLRGQIAAASPGDTVQFAPGLRGSIALGSTLTLDRNVAVVGNVDAGGNPLVTLTRSGWSDYEAGGSTDLFVSAGVTASVSGLTLTGATDHAVWNQGNPFD